MQKDKSKLLFDKYRAGMTTETENRLIEDYIFSQRENPDNLLSEQELVQQLELLSSRMGTILPRPARKLSLKVYAMVATLLLVSVSIYLSYRPLKRTIVTAYPNTIHPGNHSATLLLSNGKKIVLSAVGNGHLATESGLSISKTANGEITYTVKSKEAAVIPSRMTYNTLSTGMGEQFQVALPDGTSVLLNAGSSLRYPTRFAQNSRKVYLEGEGYFKVVKDPEHPFLVETKGQQVRVLGTQFNVSSYDDDPFVKTVLEEGAVEIIPLTPSNKQNSLKTLKLKPGEKTVLQQDKLTLSKANLEDELDWKNGYFILDNESFKVVMTKIARWYNVEIVYEGNPDDVQIGGMIPRTAEISSILNLMGQTKEVRFKIEGRRVTVIR